MDNKKKELIDLIEKFIAIAPTQEEEDHIVARIEELSPDTYWSDYIFYSKEFKRADGSTDVEKIVDKLFDYKPIIIPPDINNRK